MILTAKQNDRVDLLVWAETGKDKDLVERVVAYNPGLAKVMYDLPIGYQFEVPDWMITQAVQAKTIRRLW